MTGRNRARSHSGAWRGLKTKWDLKLSLPSSTYLIRYLFSKSEQQLPSSSSTLSSSDSSGAWIFSHFRIQVRSADECVAPERRQPRGTRWTSDGRLSSPETNLKVGLLPLFFMQLLLSHMFLSFMVRTSPLRNWKCSGENTAETGSQVKLNWGGGGGGGQWPIGFGVGLRNKRSSVRIRPWPLCWVLGQGSLLPLFQGEAFTLASISYLAILVKYILAKKKKTTKGCSIIIIIIHIYFERMAR